MQAKDDRVFHDLSFGQKSLYIFQKMHPGKNFPNISMAGKILSDIDLNLLKTAFQIIIHRHPSLRTRYSMEGGEPKQKIYSDQPIDFKLLDASDWDEKTLKQKIDQFALLPFKLDKDLLMRVTVFLTNPGEHILLLTFHHIAVDLWSLALIFDQLRTIYKELLEGQEVKKISTSNYLDFVRWQNNFVNSPEGKSQLAYWEKILRKEFEPLSFPSGGSKTESGLSPCKAEYFKWDQALSKQIIDYANNQKTTINTVLLAAFFILLGIYTKKKRFFIKSLSSGRSRLEFEKTIGFFVNPVILHTNLSEKLNFSEITKQIKKTVFNALNNQDYPFPLINESISLAKESHDEEHSDIQFILQSPHLFLDEKRTQASRLKKGALSPGNTGIKVNLGGFLIEKINLEETEIMNDLSIHIVDVGREISGALYYKRSKFKKIYISEFSRNFKIVMKALLSEPETPLEKNIGLSAIKIAKIRNEPEKEKRARKKASPQSSPQDVGIDEIESALLEIWKQVLIMDKISPMDNFFELGGHSISAMQIVSRVSDLYNIDLPLWELFENPTLSGLADVIKKNKSVQSLPPLSHIPRSTALPLSYAQERFWFLDRMMEGQLPYTLPLSISISGPFQFKILLNTFRELTKRHEILRTSFHMESSGLRQVIHKKGDLSYSQSDLSELDEESRQKKIEEIAFRESQRNFDLKKNPLYHFELVDLGQNKFTLFVTFHHIIMDGMSLIMLLKEFSRIYESLHLDKSPDLHELNYHYSDFAHYQKKHLNPRKNPDQLEFWIKNLENCKPFIFPEDKPRPPVKTHNGKVQQFTFPEDQISELRSLASRKGVTLYILFLSLFKTLLLRYTGREDITLGTPVNGRILKETEHMIGCFLNILVLRTKISPDLHFLDILEEVKATVKEAFDNQDIPFETLIKHIDPERDLSHDPLFGVMFIFQKSTGAKQVINNNIVLSQKQQTWYRSVHDLSMFIVDLDDQINGFVEYNTDLFTPGLITDLINNFKFLIRETLHHLEIPVSRIPLMNSNAVKKLNTPGKTVSLSKNFIDLFQEMVKKNPDADAVVQGSARLNYRELNEGANRIAWDLIQRDPSGKNPVAVYMPPGIDYILSILGILKSGRPYLPLNPKDPVSRTRYFIENGNADLVFSDKSSVARIKSLKTPVLTIDRGNRELSDENSINPDLPIGFEDLAYIIYTSGSTGKPKGVMVSHRSLTNYITWSRKYYKVENGDGVPLFSSPSVDFTITTIFPPLISGQKIFTVTDTLYEFLTDPDKEWKNLSFIKLTPSHLSLLVKKMESSNMKIPAGALILGGEELMYTHLGPIREKNPGLRIINEYGPTEATVGCSFYEVPVNHSSARGRVPIGHCIPNTIIQILDKNLQPLPAGISGEIYIGGDCLSTGYFNNPGLSNQRFININSPEGAEINMYKTGDKGVRLSDGTLQFLGRIDNQLNIRGFRVETGEIESAILRYPNIDQAAVVMKGDSPYSQALVAFISGKKPTEINIDQLKAYLRGYLPEYMIPYHFILLDKLPHTGSNKIDRKKLSEFKLPAVINGPSKGPFETEIQKKIADIFSALLGQKALHPHNDFFSLGGHSLQVVSLAEKINQTFGSGIKIVDIFRNPTIRGIESMIVSAKGGNQPHADNGPLLIRLNPGEHEQNIILLHPAGGGIDDYRFLTNDLKQFISVSAVKYIPEKNNSLDLTDLIKLGEKYAALIADEGVTGPVSLAGWSFGAALALSVAKHLEAMGRELKQVCLLDPVFLRSAGNREPEINTAAIKEILSPLKKGEVSPSEELQRVEDEFGEFYRSISNLVNNDKIDQIIRWIGSHDELISGDMTEYITMVLNLTRLHHNMLKTFKPEIINAPIYINFAEKRSDPGEKGYEVDNLTCGGLSIDETDAGHFSLLRPPYASNIAEKIRELLT